MLRDALLENLHRSQLNPLEEAAAYQQLLEDFGCTHDELAARIGRSRPQISNTLRLLKLSPAVQRRVAAGVLSAGHARSLLGVEDPDLQDRLAAPGGRRGHQRARPRGDRRGRRPRHGRAGPAPEQARRPRLADLADRLSDRLETRVKVDLGQRKGKITVEFASLDDLRRIVDLMDPHATGRQTMSDKSLCRQIDDVDISDRGDSTARAPARRQPARRSGRGRRSRSHAQRRRRRWRRAAAACSPAARAAVVAPGHEARRTRAAAATAAATPVPSTARRRASASQSWAASTQVRRAVAAGRRARVEDRADRRLVAHGVEHSRRPVARRRRTSHAGQVARRR